MKEELFSPSANLFTLFPVSAYETAWVAMVPDPDDPTSPMFPEYLDWVLRSQSALGFWFDEQHDINNDHHELIDYKHQCSSDDLLATIACLIALKTWESNGFSHRINKGLRFLQYNMEKELMNMRKRKEGGDEVGNAPFRMWFLMVELCKAKGLKVISSQQINNELFYEFKLNEKKLSREETEDMIKKERLVMRENAFENYGPTLLLRSPSVTAFPPIFSMDKDFMKLCVVDHLERLGCAEHFSEEIKHAMDHLYEKWIEEESEVPRKDVDVFQIYNDSLAFRLLRMHGYPVSPRRFCWFIDDEKILSHMKDNYAFFLGPILSIYKASHIAFLDDHDLDKAGLFSLHILQKGLKSMKSQNETNISYSLKKFEQEIEHELEHKWLARMDHLEYRLYIERGGVYNFWAGKNAPYKILQNNDLLQFAIYNFMMRQSLYRKELNELHRWSKDTGLSMMGFGREKTTYCYFPWLLQVAFLLTQIQGRKPQNARF
ncbi:hypothetical protein KFK09_012914 [Dendrobium nobile]|uniref:Terpene synthase N-terminal domain-containing protein n=1 Tax=Dendrobium nobile TaxID=94219 RepID=A0A8T3BKQ8_DENNO|nr:hypothetical protein KFK09_012914 [Dendrobium nobile]